MLVATDIPATDAVQSQVVLATRGDATVEELKLAMKALILEGASERLTIGIANLNLEWSSTKTSRY